MLAKRRMRLLFFVVVVASVVSCSPTIPGYQVKFSGNNIQVPVAGFINTNYNIVSDEGPAFDILLVKDSQLAYRAMYLQCPYDRQALEVFPAQAQVICPVCHSVFDFDGAVKKGPAENPLTKFATELSTDQTLVRINIESLTL